MPPRKNKKHGKVPRLPTQFGELDTTPTSRHFQSPQGKFQDQRSARAGANPSAAQARPMATQDEFEDELEDVDLIAFDEAQAPPQVTFEQRAMVAWSEAGSLTRRSSPILSGETPRDLWEFDQEDSPNPFTSPASGTDKLPDTMPLPPDAAHGSQLESPAGIQKPVDFSETASTVRRSSPVTFELPSTWDSKPASSFNTTTLPETHPLPPPSPTPHFPADEIYDATPPRTQTQVATSTHLKTPGFSQAPQNVVVDPTPPETLQKEVVPVRSARKGPKRSLGELLQAELGSEDEGPPPQRTKGHLNADVNDHPNMTLCGDLFSPDKQPQDCKDDQRAKKRKQRAKTPIQFDETTQKVKEVSRPKQPTAPVRMSIVSALRDSVQPSSSPVINTKKKAAPKQSQPKKQRKTVPPKAQRQKPATVNKHPVATASHAQSETLQQLPMPKLESKAGETVASKETKVLGGTNSGSSAAQLIVLSSDSDEISFTPESSAYSPVIETTSINLDSLINEGNPDVSNLHNSGIPQSRQSKKGKDLEPQTKPAISKAATNTHEDTHEDESWYPILDKPNARPPKQVNSSSQNQAGGSRRNLKSRSALAPRNPNILSKQSPIYRKDEVQTKAMGTTRYTQAAPTHSPAKICKLSRHFSISEAGSPVPVESGRVPLVDQTNLDDFESSKLVDNTTSRKLEYSSSKARQREPLLVSEDPTLLGSDLRYELQSSMPFGSSNSAVSNRNPAPADKESGRRSQHIACLPPQFASMNKDMHDRILAALQGQDVASNTDKEKNHKNDSDDANRAGDAKVRVRKPGNDMAEQLHGIVDMMMDHLQSKEGAVYHTAEAYRKNGLGCVEKIENKYRQEREVLTETSLKDSAQFIQSVQKAKAAVVKNEQKRQDITTQVVESLAARRLLYQRATANLRSLRRRLLEGEAVEDDT